MKGTAETIITSPLVQEVLPKLPYAGTAVTIIGGYSLNEWLAICGIVFTVLTFGLNWYFNIKRLKLMKADMNKSAIKR
jgi:uncharacterized membrane protein